MAIQQVINDSPITGWTWIPGAGENGGTCERRAHVTPFAAPESLVSGVFPDSDMFPPHHCTGSRQVDRIQTLSIVHAAIVAQVDLASEAA
jgi:hypothetical protein